MSAVSPLVVAGHEVWPLIEGGKGVAVSNGRSAGAWAAAGGVGTFSAVNADVLDDNGDYVPLVFQGRDRQERHRELIDYSIRGAVSQARLAHETRGGEGRLHMNVLWEMGGCERVLTGVLEQCKGLIHGVTCGAGMPYKLGEICAGYGVHYYPIISSARAFNALWKRAYSKVSDWLGAVVYEDPWRAGGHNGLSNSEDPRVPEDPYPRVLELRNVMRKMGLDDVPIIMAGGVWYLRDWKEWIDSKELGPIAFQFGTRPLLTKESPIPGELEEAAARHPAGRRAAASLQPHRLLLVGRAQPVSPGAGRALGAAGRDQRRGGRVRRPRRRSSPMAAAAAASG